MFHYLMTPIRVYNLILIAAAIIPAAYLMLRVYKSDRLERESKYMIWSLIKAGILSALLALVEERVLEWVLNLFLSPGTVLYNAILYFGIVAFAEESSKYLLMRRETWKDGEFNCRYDGVVYAVFVSLGFALWENVSYVLSYGFSTALVRAVTAIPGHACFGVFMGLLYGAAKQRDRRGDVTGAKTCSVLSVIIPALLHGTYDYIASMEAVGSGWYFVLFIAVLFALSLILIRRASKNDHYI